MISSFARWSAASLALLALCVGSAAMAANQLADEKIAVAAAAIARAEQAGAPLQAPVEMAQARDKLVRAQKFNSARDFKPAALWAEQANVDAEVAEATAQLQRSRKAAQEFDANMQALRQEALQNSPAQ